VEKANGNFCVRLMVDENAIEGNISVFMEN
jgi:hypothetical protein